MGDKKVEKFEPFFSVNDFREWMESNASESFNLPRPKSLVGEEVLPKVSLKRLISRMHPEEGDAIEIAKEFKYNGGKVIDVDGNNIMIEVANGTFIVPRFCIERK